MSQTREVPAQPAHQAETTFKNYKSDDAARYAAHRRSYAPKLIELVVETHIEGGGQLERVVDIGCGPGIATRQIASHFKHVVGIDASVSMIETARQTECLSATGEQATFEVCASEDLDDLLEPDSVDLITVATAAHWFDMPRFYAAASKVLRSSGSIAMWCNGRWYPDPRSTPNADGVQRLWDELELEILKPYELPGNVITRNLYDALELPWTIDGSSQSTEIASALSTYDQAAYFRREFNRDGTPDPTLDSPESNGFLTWTRSSLGMVEKLLGTSSPVTRWRQAHKEQLERGEIEDCVKRMVSATRAELAKAGPEWEGREWFDVGISAVLIVVKKKA